MHVLSLLLLSVSLLVPAPIHASLQQQQQQKQQQQDQEEECTQEAEPVHWIVRLHSYENAESIKTRLHEDLPVHLRDTWEWVARDNRAQAIPTDFALLAIRPQHHSPVADALLQLPLVKDMHPDKRLQGSLKWTPEGPLADAINVEDSEDVGEGGAEDGGFTEAGEHLDTDMEGGEDRYAGYGVDDEVDEFDVSVTKRPGRFATPFMMQPEDEEGSNDEGEDTDEKGEMKGTGGRRTLLGRTSVTSLLQAPHIWELGYSGRGVKVDVCACVRVCMCVCRFFTTTIGAHSFVFSAEKAKIQAFTNLYACTHTHTYTRTCVHTHRTHTHAYRGTHAHTHTHTHTYTHTRRWECLTPASVLAILTCEISRTAPIGPIKKHLAMV